MLIIFDGYYLLKEVTSITKRTTSYYICNYKNKIININRTRYIKKECIEYRYRKELSNLQNHIPIRLFCDYIGISYLYLKYKIDFMKENKNIEFFKYKEINKNIYIVVDNEFKKYLTHYTPFKIHLKENYKNMEIKASKNFANYIIGFY